MKGKRFVAEYGKTYKNTNGSEYKCLSRFPSEDGATFICEKSGWVFFAINPRVYEDGTIDWEHSKHGRFL